MIEKHKCSLCGGDVVIESADDDLGSDIATCSYRSVTNEDKVASLTKQRDGLLKAARDLSAVGNKPIYPRYEYRAPNYGKWVCAVCDGTGSVATDIKHYDDCVYMALLAAIAAIESAP